MIHYNVCNDKGKYCAILWTSGQLDLVIPLALKLKYTPWVMFGIGSRLDLTHKVQRTEEVLVIRLCYYYKC